MGDTDAPDLVDDVEQNGWDTDDLVEHAFVGPEDDGTTEVILHEGMEDAGAELQERNGDEYLVWEYEDAEIALSNEGFNDWRAEIALPDGITKWLRGPGGTAHNVKASFDVGTGGHSEGYIAAVYHADEATRGVLGEDVPPTRLVVRTATNHQPEALIESLIRDLWEYAEESEAGAAEAEAAFEAAKENKSDG
jgi:uncharacterized protein YndB with AHSA1/START domain